MRGNIIGEPFDSFVYDQIDVRQDHQAAGFNDSRTPSQIQYLNNKHAWVKMASSVAASGSLGENRIEHLITNSNPDLAKGHKLAQNAVLFGSLSSQINKNDKEGEETDKFNYYVQRGGIFTGKNIFNKSYSYGVGGRDFGIRPAPGILNVNIDCVNRGSIRTAEVVIKAYNKFQFELIELLYLRVGYTMLLEWGNNIYLDKKSDPTNQPKIQTVGNTLIEDVWFENNGISQLEMYQKIQDERAKYSGNYDGFMGVVRNFNWSFESDGTYNITIDLVTVGDIIESLRVNLPISKTLSTFTNVGNESEEGAEINEINNVIELFLFSMRQQLTYDEEFVSPDFLYLKGKPKGKTNAQRFQEFRDDPVGLEYDPKLYSLDKLDQKYHHYITFGRFLEELQKRTFPVKSPLGGSKDKKHLPIEFDLTEDTYMGYNLNQIPVDPQVCLFNFPTPNLGADQGTLNIPSVFTEIKNKSDFIVEEEGHYAGRLFNLFLNFDFIEKCIKESIDKEGKASLFRVLQKICDGINSSMGNVNQLEPILKEDRIITFIDQSMPLEVFQIFNDSTKTVVNLELLGYNPSQSQPASNFVTNINFKTSIPPELASMITIGAAASGGKIKGIDDTYFSKWNEGLKDRYSAQYESPIQKLEQESLLAQERKIWLDKALQAFDVFAEGEGKIQNKKFAAQSSYATGRRVETDTKRFNVKNQYNKCLGDSRKSVNRKDYKEDVLNCFRQKRVQAENDSNSKTEGIESYLEYLVKAFGGKNIKIGDNKKTPDVDPSNAQYFSGDNAIISRGKTTYKEYLRIINNIAFEKSREQAKKIGDLFSSNQLGFIPIQLGLELQGISGIKNFNKLEINQNFLPSNYPQSLQFIIQKVNHQLTNGEWTTALDTLSIPKNYFKGKLESPNFTYELEEDGAEFVSGFKSSLPPLLRDAIQPYREKTFTKDEVTLVSIPDLNNDANWGIKNFNSAVRDNFQSFLQDLVRDEKYKGWIFYVRSTYRSFEEQYNLHKNKPDQGEAVQAGNSYHNYGAAIDLLATQPTVGGDYNHLGWTTNSTVAIPRGGLYTDTSNPQSLKDLTDPYVLVKNTRPGQWVSSGIVEKANKYNIAWGGNIEGIVDYNHFYVPFDKTTARARGIEQYGSVEKINGLEIKIDDLLYLK